MENERIVLYMNWDGFAYYYYEEARKRGIIPTIERLGEHGVVLDNAYSGIPSITNPMQTAIASGCYASGTGNVKLYYDKEHRKVIAQRRENKAENIVFALKRQGVRCASVHHFTFEENGCYFGSSDSPYVFIPQSVYTQRFSQLLHLVKGENVISLDKFVKSEGNYQFIAFYLDDLDTVGHNNAKLAPYAENEERRVGNVMWRLSLLDKALGAFLDELEKCDLLDKVSLVLATDHGMTPFSFSERSLRDYNDLLQTITSMGYTYEVLSPLSSPAENTDIVLCSAGLSLLLSFTDINVPKDNVLEMKEILGKKRYVGNIMDKWEIMDDGSMDFCDLYISPKVPGIFKPKAPHCGGAHDSLDETSQHIFTLFSGSGIRKGVRVQRKIRNIDYASTMCALLGCEPPHDNKGKCIKEIFDERQER